MINIAVLASGNGSNFQAILKAQKKGVFNANIKLLITDKKKSYVRIRAKRLGVNDVFIDPHEFKTRLEFDKKLAGILKKEKIHLVVLAGFMRILTPYFIKTFKNKILNIHPSILPAFKGANAIKDAFNYGVKITGVTIHFVDEKVDHGPIILQEAVKIKPQMKIEKLKSAIHKLEHRLYPLAVKLFTENKISLTRSASFIH